MFTFSKEMRHLRTCRMLTSNLARNMQRQKVQPFETCWNGIFGSLNELKRTQFTPKIAQSVAHTWPPSNFGNCRVKGSEMLSPPLGSCEYSPNEEAQLNAIRSQLDFRDPPTGSWSNIRPLNARQRSCQCHQTFSLCRARPPLLYWSSPATLHTAPPHPAETLKETSADSLKFVNDFIHSAHHFRWKLSRLMQGEMDTTGGDKMMNQMKDRTRLVDVSSFGPLVQWPLKRRMSESTDLDCLLVCSVLGVCHCVSLGKRKPTSLPTVLATHAQRTSHTGKNGSRKRCETKEKAIRAA